METIRVTILDMPKDALERLRALAQTNGVGTSNTDVLRWAALQWLKQAEESTSAQAESSAGS